MSGKAKSKNDLLINKNNNKMILSFTPIESLPAPPEWMIKEAELFEKMEEMVEEDNKKRLNYYKKKGITEATIFNDFDIGKNYTIIWNRGFHWKCNYNQNREHLVTIKFLRITRCYVTFSINGEHPWRKRIQDMGNWERVDCDGFILNCNEIYDPKNDEDSAARIIQRAFKFHRWDIKGKFIWRVEERHMNDDGFFWDENGDMIKN